MSHTLQYSKLIPGLKQIKVFKCDSTQQICSQFCSVQFSSVCVFSEKLILVYLCLPQQLLMDKRVGLKRYELSGRKVLFYFDEVSLIQFPHCCVSQGCWWMRRKLLTNVCTG